MILASLGDMTKQELASGRRKSRNYKRSERLMFKLSSCVPVEGQPAVARLL